MAFSRAVKINPSVLAADFADLAAECRRVAAAGGDWVHLDVMDGHFVPNISFGAGVCAALRGHVGVMDVHLMAERPMAMLGQFAMADVVTVHVEAGTGVAELQAIRAMGCKAGLAVCPGTPDGAVAGLLDLVDVLCVLTVNPGFGGQRMLPGQVERVARLRRMIGARPVHLEVDGGVAVENVGALVAAGADALVVGGYIFGGDAGERIAALRAAAGRGAAPQPHEVSCGADHLPLEDGLGADRLGD